MQTKAIILGLAATMSSALQIDLAHEGYDPTVSAFVSFYKTLDCRWESGKYKQIKGSFGADEDGVAFGTAMGGQWLMDMIGYSDDIQSVKVHHGGQLELFEYDLWDPEREEGAYSFFDTDGQDEKCYNLARYGLEDNVLGYRLGINCEEMIADAVYDEEEDDIVHWCEDHPDGWKFDLPDVEVDVDVV